jgi:hypothetical protein
MTEVLNLMTQVWSSKTQNETRQQCMAQLEIFKKQNAADFFQQLMTNFANQNNDVDIRVQMMIVLLRTLEEPLVIFQNHPKTQTPISPKPKPQFPRNKNTNIRKLQSKVLFSSFMNLKYFPIPKIAKPSIGISELLALHA